MPPKSSAAATARQIAAARIAANRAQAAAEAPIRAARRALAARLSSATSSLHKANQRLADKLHYRTTYWLAPDGTLKEGDPKLWDWELKPLEARVTEAAANFQSRLTDLEAFDLMHGIEGASYPRLVEVDRAAIEAQARAKHEASMQRAREWVRNQQMETAE